MNGQRVWRRVLGPVSVVLLAALGLTSVVASRQVAHAVPQHTVQSGPGRWANQYNGPGGDDRLTDLAVSPDGSFVVVTGFSSGVDGDFDWATIAYDAVTGSERWVARYEQSSGGISALGVAVAGGGSIVVVAGDTYSSETFGDFATVGYDAATGDELWVALYNGSEMDDVGKAITVSPDGETVFVTGDSGGHQSKSSATVAYDARTGTQLWVAVSSVGRVLFPVGIAATPDGSTVVVTATKSGSQQGNDVITIAYDTATGSQRWLARYDRGDFNSASAITASPDSSMVGVAMQTVGADFDYLTVVYDAFTGQERWASHYDGPAQVDDYVHDIVFTPDSSSVAVTGVVNWLDSDDYGTVAYDAATGAEEWVAIYDGPANRGDGGEAVTASPDGRMIVVTGWSGGVATNLDIGTVAYDSVTGVELKVARAGRKAYDSGNSVAFGPDGSTLFVGGGFDEIEPYTVDYAVIAYGF